MCSLVVVGSPDIVGSLFNVESACYSRQCADSLLCGESCLGSIAESRAGNHSISVGSLGNLGSLKSVGSVVWGV